MAADGPYSKPEPGEVEVGSSTAKNIVKSNQFYTKPFTVEGREFFIFSRFGDYIKGMLLGGSNDNRAFNRTKSFRMELYQGKQHGEKLDVAENDIVEFFANRQLQHLIKRHELANKIIRIIYIGREKNPYTTHSAKVYRVFIDKGFFKESEEECNGREKRKSAKKVTV